MKRKYTLFQQHIAYVLFVSLSLQNCGGLDNNPLVPIEGVQTVSVQTHAQATLLPINIEPLLDQELTAQGGDIVTCYQEAGILKANVEMNAPQGFSKTYQGVEVLLEQGTDVARLVLDNQSQRRRIHFQLSQSGNPTRVIIYKDAGLMGSGKDKKGKQLLSCPEIGLHKPKDKDGQKQKK